MIPTKIILHHSLTADGETVSWGAIRRYHRTVMGWRDIGYHYGIELVDRAPEILVGRMMNEYGAHCRGAGMNRRSLGVCFVGNFDDQPPAPAIWDAGLKLVGSLVDMFNISPKDVHGHCAFSGKSCPGKRFDVERFREQLR